MCVCVCVCARARAQGFSTAMGFMNMRASLSYQGVVSLFDRSHVAHQHITPSYHNHHLKPRTHHSFAFVHKRILIPNPDNQSMAC